MCEGPDGFVQAGIVSWGIGCGLNDVPGGYVNIGKYVCWIKSLVEEVRICCSMNMMIIML